MQEKLHPFHITLLFYMTQTGVVLFSLPRLLADRFGYNGWVFLFVCAAVSTFNIFLISIVYRKGKGRSIYEIMEQSISKILLYPIYLVLILLWGTLGCLVAKQYSTIFQMVAFPTSHPMIFKLMIDVLVFLLVIKGIYSISKAVTSFFWMIVWMNVLLLFFWGDFEWARLTPFFFQGGTNDWLGALDIYTAFLGYEAAIILIPFAEKDGKFIRAVYIGNFATALGYFLFTIICFGFYSIEQIGHMKYPILDLLSYIRLPFIERIEYFLFGFFLLSVVVTFSIYVWMSLETARRLMPKANIKWLTIIILFIVFGITWIPDVSDEIEASLRYFGFAGTAVAFALPMLIIIILAFQKGARGNV